MKLAPASANCALTGANGRPVSSPVASEDQPGDVLSEVSSVHPAHILQPGHPRGTHGSADVGEVEQCWWDRQGTGEAGDEFDIAQPALTALDRRDLGLSQPDHPGEGLLRPAGRSAHLDDEGAEVIAGQHAHDGRTAVEVRGQRPARIRPDPFARIAELALLPASLYIRVRFGT